MKPTSAVLAIVLAVKLTAQAAGAWHGIAQHSIAQHTLQNGSGHLHRTLACFCRRSGTGGSRHSAKSSSSTTTSAATTSAQRPIATFLPSLRNQAGSVKKQPSPTASTGDRTIRCCCRWSCLLLPGHKTPSPLPSHPLAPAHLATLNSCMKLAVPSRFTSVQP